MTTAIEYALMAGASYYDTRAEINRFVLPQDWSVYSRFPANASSGFEAATYHGQRGQAQINPDCLAAPPAPCRLKTAAIDAL